MRDLLSNHSITSASGETRTVMADFVDNFTTNNSFLASFQRTKNKNDVTVLRKARILDRYGCTMQST